MTSGRSTRAPWRDWAVIAALVVVHAVAMWIWLGQNDRPPMDDEAFHLRSSLLYLRWLQDWSPGWFDRFLAVDDFYPPFFPFCGAVVQWMFGASQDVAIMTNAVFWLVLLGATCAIGRRLGGIGVGLLAACLVSLYPMVFGLAKMFMLELALCAMVAATVALLCEPRRLGSSWRAAWLGAIMGVGCLTKPTYPIFIVGPLVVVLWRGAKAWGRTILGRRLVIVMLTLAAVAGPWYLAHLPDAWRLYWYFSVKDPLLIPGPVVSPAAWGFYAAELVRGQLHVFFTGLFGAGLLAFWQVRSPEARVIWAWLTVPVLVLTAFPCKYQYYTVPSLPAVALVTAQGLSLIRPRLLRVGVMAGVLGFGTLQALAMASGSAVRVATPWGTLRWSYEDLPALIGFQHHPVGGDWRMDELFAFLEERAGGRGDVRIGVSERDGGLLQRQGVPWQEHYIPTDVDALTYQALLRGCAYGFRPLVLQQEPRWLEVLTRLQLAEAWEADMQYADHERFDALITHEPAEQIRPPIPGGPYRMAQVLTMPDGSPVYLYVPGPGSEGGGIESAGVMASRSSGTVAGTGR